MAPPWTNSWDETKPADADLANTLGTQIRQFKLDTRQRLDWQHVFNQNVNDDGGHRFVLIASAYHPANTESFKASGFSLTGANAQSCLDISGTWSTSGNPTGIKLNITNAGSGSSSLLLDLQIAGTSKFKVDKSGNVTSTGAIVGTIFGVQSTIVNNDTGTSTYGPTTVTTDGFLYGWVSFTSATLGNQLTMTVGSDASGVTNPTRLQLSGTSTNPASTLIPYCLPVHKGETYKIFWIPSSGGLTTYWIPLGGL